jgi:hypothetical protein
MTPGQVVRTVNPDGSEQCWSWACRPTPADPEAYAPTTWESYTYDANDNAGRTHAEAAAGYQSHWNSPASFEVDALGRTVRAVAHNGPDPPPTGSLPVPPTISGQPAHGYRRAGPGRVPACV